MQNLICKDCKNEISCDGYDISREYHTYSCSCGNVTFTTLNNSFYRFQFQNENYVLVALHEKMSLYHRNSSKKE